MLSAEHVSPEGQLQDGILLHPGCWCDDVNTGKLRQCENSWHAFGTAVNPGWQNKVCEALGFPGWSSSSGWKASVIIFQGKGGKHNRVPWQKLECRRRSRGAGAARDSHNPVGRVCSRVRRAGDAHTALHEGEHKCRVPYGSELPDVSPTWWQDLPVIAWPVFPLHEKCSSGK